MSILDLFGRWWLYTWGCLTLGHSERLCFLVILYKLRLCIRMIGMGFLDVWASSLFQFLSKSRSGCDSVVFKSLGCVVWFLQLGAIWVNYWWNQEFLLSWASCNLWRVQGCLFDSICTPLFDLCLWFYSQNDIIPLEFLQVSLLPANILPWYLVSGL